MLIQAKNRYLKLKRPWFTEIVDIVPASRLLRLYIDFKRQVLKVG